MNIEAETLTWIAVSTSLSVALLFFCIRAYRRSRQPGFLLLALALVIVPQLSGFANRPLLDWVRDQGGSAQTFGLINLAQMALRMTILSVALILLARPLHRGRRV